jgi:hypothetical protein
MRKAAFMKTKVLALVLPALFVLAGCTVIANSSSVSSLPASSEAASSVVSSESPVISSVSSSEAPSYVSTSYYSDGVSVSGVLLDASLGVDLVNGKTYSEKLTYKNAPSNTVAVSYSVPGILTFEGDLANGFTLTALKAGGTVMTIRDSTDYMILRIALNVREPLTAAKLDVFMTDEVKYFEMAMGYDSYKLTFTGNKTGIFTAKEGDNAYGAMSFTYTMKTAEENDQDFYYYDLLVTMDDNAAAIKISEIHASVVGTTLHVYEKDGIIGILNAVM